MIEAHLRSIAPNVLDPFRLEIEIKEILRADEHNREVRFSARFQVDWDHDPSNRIKPIFTQPNELSAFFQRSDSGWTLARYGEPMKNMVARLWHFQMRSRYVSLLDALSILGKEATRWESERVENLRSRQPSAWGEYLTGISELELNRRAIVKDIQVPIGVQWGVLSAPNSEFYSILWAKLIEEPDVVCALRIGSRAEERHPPMEFSWMDKSARLICKGRGVVFNPYTATNEGLALIDKSGGILQPIRER